MIDAQMKFTVRGMTVDDFPSVFAIGESIFTYDYSKTMYRLWNECEIASIYNGNRNLCIVAEIEGEIIGFILGIIIKKSNSPCKYGHLSWLGVSENAQCGGVGSALVSEFKDRMKQMDVDMILVDTDGDNIAGADFFTRHGFDDIQPHIYMSLNLTAMAEDECAW